MVASQIIKGFKNDIGPSEMTIAHQSNQIKARNLLIFENHDQHARISILPLLLFNGTLYLVNSSSFFYPNL